MRDDELERMRARRTRTPKRRQDEDWLDEDYDEDYYYDDEEEDDYDAYEEALRRQTRSAMNRERNARQQSRPSASRTSRTSRSNSSASRSSSGSARRTGTSQRSSQRSAASSQRSSSPNRARSANGGAGNGRGNANTSGQRRANSRPQGQQQYKHKKKKKRSWLRMIFTIFLVALVLWVGNLAWAFVNRQTGTWTIAVFGVDSRDGGVEKNALADVQMICVIDRETGDIKLSSVFRDTYLKINSEGTYHKINEAYFKGGHKQAVHALEENLDLKVDNYATFNWKAVADAINILGGVDLEITDAEFKYINAFITETVNSTGIGSYQLKQAGMNHLDGVQAVAYCRLRLMDTDFQRTERQRKVVSLALEKAKQADNKTLVSLVSAVLPQLSTDIGMDDVLPMAKNVSKYHLGETQGFPTSRQTKKVGRMDCVIPTTLESNVIQLHQFLYGVENYQPSSAVKKISQHISEETGLYEEGKPAPTSSGSGFSKKQSAKPAQTTAASTEAATEEDLLKNGESADDTADSDAIGADDESSTDADDANANANTNTNANINTNEAEDVLIEELNPKNDSTSEEKGPGIANGSQNAQNGSGINLNGSDNQDTGSSNQTDSGASENEIGPGV